jgi:hypothetical protein
MVMNTVFWDKKRNYYGKNTASSDRMHNVYEKNVALWDITSVTSHNFILRIQPSGRYAPYSYVVLCKE